MHVIAQLSDALIDDLWGPTSVALISLGCLCGLMAIGKKTNKPLRRAAAVTCFLLMGISLAISVGRRNFMLIALAFYSFAEIAITIHYCVKHLCASMSRGLVDSYGEPLVLRVPAKSDAELKSSGKASS